jgi:hypothetical protein
MFISGKDARIYLAPADADTVASTAFFDFDKMAVNWAISQQKATTQVPTYGQADVTLAGYSSWSVSGQVYLDLTSGRVTKIAITNAGSGYTSAPTIAFTGGGGTGAAASAVIDTAGLVRYIVITNWGSGYTSAPTVAFSGGGGSGAAATVTINDYSDEVLADLYAASNVKVKIALIGTTASSKKPYYEGTMVLASNNIAIPSNGAVAFTINGSGSGDMTRGEF